MFPEQREHNEGPLRKMKFVDVDKSSFQPDACVDE